MVGQNSFDLAPSPPPLSLSLQLSKKYNLIDVCSVIFNIIPLFSVIFPFCFSFIVSPAKHRHHDYGGVVVVVHIVTLLVSDK